MKIGNKIKGLFGLLQLNVLLDGPEVVTPMWAAGRLDA
jgi:hypothetical protein